MKKKLIFHFYIPDDWDTHPIINLHFKLLRHYANFFDEVKFILAIDNTEDIDTILKIENGLIDIGFHNVEFKIIKNNPFVKDFTQKPIKKSLIIDYVSKYVSK